MSKNNIQQSTTWSAYIGNLATSTIAGTITHGLQGGAIALTSTFADEFLINKGYTAKHYLSSSALYASLIVPVGQTLAGTFPEWSLPIYAGSVAAVGAFSYYGNDPLNYQQNINQTVGYLSPVFKLFDDKKVFTKEELNKVYNIMKSNPYEGTKVAIKDLNYILHNKLLMTSAAKIGIGFLEIYINNSCNKYIGNNGTTMLAITLLQQNPTAGALELAFNGLKISGLLSGKSLINSALEFGKNYLDNELKKAMTQKSIEQLLLNEEHIHKLLSLDGSSQIIQNLKSDLQNSLTFGEAYMQLITNSKLKEFAAFNEVVQLAPESLLISTVYSCLKKSIKDLVKKNLTTNMELQSKITSEQWAITSDLCNNFANAVLTDSTKFIKAKHINNLDKISKIEYKDSLLNKFESISNEALDVVQKFIDVVYYAYKVTNGQLKLEQLPMLYGWIHESSSLLQGGMTLSTPFAEVSKARLHKLLDAISSSNSNSAKHSFNHQNKIIIDNYELKIKDLVALNINHLELELNKHYAISGTSGLGKTSMLKDIQGCLINPLNSSGEISLPIINGKEVKPMFIDQNLYIPATATLFEAITLKSSSMIDAQTKLTLKAQIIELFKELTIDASAAVGDETQGLISELDNASFDTSNLSGGQKKKVGIIKAILAKPEILIMDEVFVGLDQKSLIIAQKLINKYLPHTTLIIVDHTAANNNYDNFYNAEIHFTKDSQDMHEIDSKNSLLSNMVSDEVEGYYDFSDSMILGDYEYDAAAAYN